MSQKKRWTRAVKAIHRGKQGGGAVPAFLLKPKSNASAPVSYPEDNGYLGKKGPSTNQVSS